MHPLWWAFLILACGPKQSSFRKVKLYVNEVINVNKSCVLCYFVCNSFPRTYWSILRSHKTILGTLKLALGHASHSLPTRVKTLLGQYTRRCPSFGPFSVDLASRALPLNSQFCTAKYVATAPEACLGHAFLGPYVSSYFSPCDGAPSFPSFSGSAFGVRPSLMVAYHDLIHSAEPP